jgi:outer membrane lipoprotein carrier protein
MKFILALFIAGFAAAAQAAAQPDAIGMLQQFMTRTQTVQADFTQTIVDKNGKVVQKSSGTMALSRPGKFRWQYDKPYKQLIVGDGTRLWLYDKDLDQVTVKKLGAALGSTPAALLAGNNDIEKRYIVTDAGSSNGLQWVQAVPRTEGSGFEGIRMGFNQSGLAAMELQDQFGQTTTIRFSNVRRNPKLADNLFSFTPPQGADILGE